MGTASRQSGSKCATDFFLLSETSARLRDKTIRKRLTLLTVDESETLLQGNILWRTRHVKEITFREQPVTHRRKSKGRRMTWWFRCDFCSKRLCVSRQWLCSVGGQRRKSSVARRMSPWWRTVRIYSSLFINESSNRSCHAVRTSTQEREIRNAARRRTKGMENGEGVGYHDEIVTA